MQEKSFTSVVKSAILGIFGLILAIIVIRILLVALNANESSAFIRLWFSISDLFVAPFANMYPKVKIFDKILFELSAAAAILAYLNLTFLIYTFIEIFEALGGAEFVRRFVDFMFKCLEIVLIFRFLLRLSAASGRADFVDAILKITSLIYNPFNSEGAIIPTLRIDETAVIIELSTLLIIFIVIVFDLLADWLLTKLAEKDKQKVYAPSPATPVQNVYPTTVIHYPGPPQVQKQ